MSQIDIWLQFVAAVLATWRVTHLLACEDGPGDVIVRLRLRLRHSRVGSLMDCFNCLSIWIAFPVALFLSWNPADLILIWLALSGAACLLEKATGDPLVVQTISQKTEEEMSHGMLWSEEDKTQEHFAIAGSRATPRNR